MSRIARDKNAFHLAVLGSALLTLTAGCKPNSAPPAASTPGVLLEPDHQLALHQQTVAAVTSAPSNVMRGPGLAGVLGGARLKVLQAGEHELLLPLPQSLDTQTPLTYTIATEPEAALLDCRLRPREGGNVVAELRLKGDRQSEIQIKWSAVVLMARAADAAEHDPPEPYLRASACVQSDAPEIARLAAELQPADGPPEAYAAAIQTFIAGMKQTARPRSLDAAGILKSGSNWICTANANLAAALLRAKHIPARTLAIIPPTSQRLEMHRIVEYFHDGRWIPFDPSSLQKDIPLQPWQNVIVAATSLADEDLAMKPRLGTSPGCPYGHELEIPAGGLAPWGEDFFWTEARPLAEFAVSDEAIARARAEWTRYLTNGTLSAAQRNAAAARDAAALLDSLRATAPLQSEEADDSERR